MGASLLTPVHLMLVLVVVLLLFGAKRLPELGQSLGMSMRTFRDSIEGREQRGLPEASAQTPPAEPIATDAEQRRVPPAR
jgi:sec-independent protein translocase protein TatA